MTGLVDGALAAADRGWRVFPLAPGRKVPRKALDEWEAKATSDPDRIGRWWGRHPADNIGIATGPSHLVVVDLDVPKPSGPGAKPPPAPWTTETHGVEVLGALVRERGEPLPETWTVATPSGGWHLYFWALPARAEKVGADLGEEKLWPVLRNTAGRVGWRIDTRAAGGFVVAAGSRIPGCTYLGYRLHDNTEPAVLPEWLAALARPPAPTRPAGPARPVPRARGYVHTALTAEVQRVLDAPTGTRNHALNAATWALARFVTQDTLPRHVVEAALQHAGEATGLTPTETAATIRSALDARHRRPGGTF